MEKIKEYREDRYGDEDKTNVSAIKCLENKTMLKYTPWLLLVTQTIMNQVVRFIDNFLTLILVLVFDFEN